MKNASECLCLDNDSVAFHALAQRVAEIQGMIRRTQGVLTEDVEDGKDGANCVVTSTYPRDIQLPDNRHDNDNQVVSTFALLEKSTYHPASLPLRPASRLPIRPPPLPHPLQYAPFFVATFVISRCYVLYFEEKLGRMQKFCMSGECRHGGGLVKPANYGGVMQKCLPPRNSHRLMSLQQGSPVTQTTNFRDPTRAAPGIGLEASRHELTHSRP